MKQKKRTNAAQEMMLFSTDLIGPPSTLKVTIISTLAYSQAIHANSNIFPLSSFTSLSTLASKLYNKI